MFHSDGVASENRLYTEGKYLLWAQLTNGRDGDFTRALGEGGERVCR